MKSMLISFSILKDRKLIEVTTVRFENLKDII